MVAEDGAGLVVSGREIRATKQQRNKSLGWFSRVLSRCTKGSRRWKKLLRAKHRLKGKTNAQVQDLLHKATRKAINWCIKHQVAELVIGNPAGVEKDTKKQKRLSRKSPEGFADGDRADQTLPRIQGQRVWYRIVSRRGTGH